MLTPVEGRELEMDDGRVDSDLHTQGLCCVCGKSTTFLAKVSEWGSVRETMHCSLCLSSSRKRHVVKILLDLFTPAARFLPEAKPVLSQLSIYSAGSNENLHLCLGADNPNFICSEYFPNAKAGDETNGVFFQDLECLTFADEQFHLVITEDVFEHIRRPEKAFEEVNRVLKPDGYHIFTIPFMFDKKTLRRVNTDTDENVFIVPPAYHLDALRDKVLVYTDFGYDLFDTLSSLGFYTEVSFSQHREAIRLGIADSFVFFSRKISGG